MWSDTLFAAERSHLLRVMLWAVTSATLGTALVAFITLRRIAAPILQGFAVQVVAWGLFELIVAATSWQLLTMRDVSAATRLDRLTWLHVGLDAGIVGIGVALTVVAWMLGRRVALVGAGLGIVVQGLGLLVLNLTFASVLARLI
ncbi:MAG TPA: hypothetical protein VM076_03485 [Gemmatimonadaceae bacterium]|nr:hypothetical protein [Gemmatimonadaceae bacterium]